MEQSKIAYFQAKFQEIREAQAKVAFLTGQYNDEFGKWLQSEGVPENVALIDLIAHFAPKAPTLIA